MLEEGTGVFKTAFEQRLGLGGIFNIVGFKHRESRLSNIAMTPDRTRAQLDERTTSTPHPCVCVKKKIHRSLLFAEIIILLYGFKKTIRSKGSCYPGLLNVQRPPVWSLIAFV